MPNGQSYKNYAMIEELWKVVHYFKPEEFGAIDMDGILIYTLDNMRKFVNKKVIIHCGYEERTTGGYHPKKCAVDLHIEGLNVIDQFLVACRFDNFNGIGIYPYWNSPGLHLDTRPKNLCKLYDSRWGCNRQGTYVPLNAKFIQEIVDYL